MQNANPKAPIGMKNILMSMCIYKIQLKFLYMINPLPGRWLVPAGMREV